MRKIDKSHIDFARIIIVGLCVLSTIILKDGNVILLL